jgi:hypothetical protein
MCEDRQVVRLPSAPYVNTGAREAPVPAAKAPTAVVNEAALANAMAAMKAYILANTDDVGRLFPEVARRMHYGEEESRGIRGQVTREEAEELLEEGVPAIALPPGLSVGEDIH